MKNDLVVGALNSDAAKYAVLAVAGLAVLWYLKNKAAQAAGKVGDAAVATGNYLQNDAFRLTSDKNIATVGVTGIVDAVGGQGTTSSVFDHVFAVVDLINPFNQSDTYAKKVWGIGDDADTKNIKNNNAEGIW